MNQAELATQIAKTTGLSKAKAESALRATLRVISVEVEKGETVKLVGFGTFKQAARSARTGFNPQTKKQIKIPARTVPKFIPGKEFKELIDGKQLAQAARKSATATKGKKISVKPAAKIGTTKVSVTKSGKPAAARGSIAAKGKALVAKAKSLTARTGIAKTTPAKRTRK